jgi:hypothetical protein
LAELVELREHLAGVEVDRANEAKELISISSLHKAEAL